MLQDNVAYTRVDGDMNARVEALSVWDSAGYTRWSERFDVGALRNHTTERTFRGLSERTPNVTTGRLGPRSIFAAQFGVYPLGSASTGAKRLPCADWRHRSARASLDATQVRDRRMWMFSSVLPGWIGREPETHTSSGVPLGAV